MNSKKHIFKSDRLGFRNWEETDIEPFLKLNADEQVMQHFPKTLTKDQTISFIEKSKNQYKDKGYTYFAVDVLETNEFIGFIGLSYQTYEASFNPSVDIGWRLDKKHWGKGYATEGAKRCLVYASENLKLKIINSVCPVVNKASENVMKKIGMQKVTNFMHPALNEYPNLQECLLYQLTF